MREKIMNDAVNAMKNRNKEILSVLRMVKGAIQLEEIKTKKELSDDEVIQIISKQIKTRKESIEEFKKGNREDLIAATESEIAILEKYMPKQMDQDEIVKIIDDVFEKVKPVGLSDMGKVMGTVAPLVKGKADLGLVNKLIKEKLNSL
ncbi:MAG: GatB/YqeY domain-containing protein [Bacilli bacterium]|nr:GatB/YqeY domain-containing protein [Bacilli bacterium]MDD4608276.1 GatB/YqeY domain-containing protein [Bacilli bacterium]